jgi:tellurite resistance protein TehA-like permease
MLVALVIVVLPGGGNVLEVLLTLLSIIFLAAIAFLGYRLFRQYRFDIETLEPNVRLTMYGSIGLAILTFVATNRLFDAGGLGVLLWFALLALCSYGLYWTWTRYRSYG